MLQMSLQKAEMLILQPFALEFASFVLFSVNKYIIFSVAQDQALKWEEAGRDGALKLELLFSYCLSAGLR